MDTEFISIGPCCFTAEYIKINGLRNHSYPFDYIFLVYIIKYIPLFELKKELNEYNIIKNI